MYAGCPSLLFKSSLVLSHLSSILKIRKTIQIWILPNLNRRKFIFNFRYKCTLCIKNGSRKKPDPDSDPTLVKKKPILDKYQFQIRIRPSKKSSNLDPTWFWTHELTFYFEINILILYFKWILQEKNFLIFRPNPNPDSNKFLKPDPDPQPWL